MPVSVVIGGQYGSEGKGKTTQFFAEKSNAAAVVRVGGPNSGHTVYVKDQKFILRQLPVSAVSTRRKSIISSGSYINVDLLVKEIALTDITPNNLLIDPYAVIITEEDETKECDLQLKSKIGSTLSGTGSALLRRIARTSEILFAKDVTQLSAYIVDTKRIMRDILNSNERIIIEGTQGFGLSLLHSKHYPYVTGRDTTASAFVSEAGLSPLDVDQVIMVLRMFPIRVSGNSGPLKNELTWSDVTRLSKSFSNIVEYTSVSAQMRRVGAFDSEVVNQAILVNRPNVIVVNHMDYLGLHEDGSLSKDARNGILHIEREIGRNIDYYGSNPYTLVNWISTNQ